MLIFQCISLLSRWDHAISPLELQLLDDPFLSVLTPTLPPEMMPSTSVWWCQQFFFLFWGMLVFPLSRAPLPDSLSSTFHPL